MKVSLWRSALALLALGLAGGAWAEEPTLVELLDATDDINRGASSIAVVEMQVKTSRYERTMRMKAWSEGTEKTLIIIEEPAKDAGIATLKVDDNIWNYLPKADRTMKVPAGMMSGAWMGSHFSNDDLVKESRLSEDFDGSITSRPADNPDGVYVIDLIPKPDAAVVWGKISVRVTPEKLPVDITYYDEKDRLVRTMSFDDYRDFDGRMAPGTMLLLPKDKEGEFTKITYVSMDLDVDIPADTFTLQALKR